MRRAGWTYRRKAPTTNPLNILLRTLFAFVLVSFIISLPIKSFADTTWGNTNAFNSGSNLYNITNSTIKNGIRFTCRVGGTATQMRLRTTEAGTSGTHRWGIQADSNGEPTGTWLCSLDATTGGNGERTTTINFPDVTLTQGTVYHIVTQYQSGGSLGASDYATLRQKSPFDSQTYQCNTATPITAEYDDPDLQTEYYDGSAWVAGDGKPQFVIDYGTTDYEGSLVLVADATIAATTNVNICGTGATVRSAGEIFTVTGGPKTNVARLYAYVAKVSSPADSLYWNLYNITDTTSVTTGVLFCNSGDVTTSYSWISKVLPSPITLLANKKYRLYFTSPGSASGTGYYILANTYYDTTPTSPYFRVGFQGGSSENQGYFSLTTNNWTGQTDVTYGDAPFYWGIDNTNPTSSITMPSNGGKYNALSAITGLATDTASTGVKTNYLKIKNTTDTLYWTGAAWGVDTWLSPSSYADPTWTHDTSSVTFSNGKNYDVSFYSADYGGNVSTTTTNSFLFDNGAPVSSVTNPATNSQFNSLFTISGTASDNAALVSDVKISVKNTDLGKWYAGGTDWTAGVETWLTVTGLNTWTKTLTNISGDGNFLIRGKATDQAGNVETPGAGVSFIYDTTNPLSTISVPANEAKIKTLAGITGTGSDTSPGVLTNVYVSIKDQIGGYYNGSDFSGGAGTQWQGVTGTTSWSYPAPTWTNQQYIIRTKAVDTATNAATSGTSVTFIYDDNSPSSVITYPSNNDVKTALAGITGTATDSGGSGLQVVQTRFYNVTDNLYWDGVGTWQAGSAWVSATGLAAWTYDTSVTPLTSDRTYVIQSRAKDLVTPTENIETPGFGTTFKIDTTKPVSTVAAPLSQTYNSLPYLTGTATDATAGVNNVKFTIKNLTDTETFTTGLSWVSGSTDYWHTATGTLNWSYSTAPFALESDKNYLLVTMAEDNIANVETPGTGNTFRLDNVPPSSTINPPLNGTTYNTLSQISGTATDASSSVVSVQVNIKNITDSTVWNGGSWVSGSLNWLGATGTNNWIYNISSWVTGKVYTVQSKAADAASNTQSAFTESSFSFDNTPPTTVIAYPATGSLRSTLTVISGTSSSDTAATGVLINLFFFGGDWYNNNSFSSPVEYWLVCTGTAAWSYTPPALPSDGDYIIHTKAKDNAGNIEAPGTYSTFTYDTTKPTSTITAFTNGDKKSSLTVLSGTASSDTSSVSINIFDNNNTQYWDGDSWEPGSSWLFCTGTTGWTYSSPAWSTGVTYKISTMAKDNAGNLETVGTAWSFTYDALAPVSAVTYPASNANLKIAPEGITGTCSDAAYGNTGVSLVQMQLKCETDTKYWSGTVWDTPLAWVNVGGTTAWNYNGAVVLWEDGKTYIVKSRGKDGANNTETGSALITFKYDTTVPTTTIVSPSNGGKIKALTVITGTSSDATSGMSALYISIKSLADTKWYNGSSFVDASEKWLSPTAGLQNWNYTAPTWGDGKSYLIRKYGIDNAGNSETPGTGNSFTFDTTAPTSSVTSPVTGSQIYASPTLSGTAYDASTGIVTILLNIKDLDNTTYWTGSTWVTTDPDFAFNAGGTTTWTYSGPTYTTTHWYLIRSKAVDGAINSETPGSGITFQYLADSTQPASVVTFPANSGNYFSPAVISGTSSDTMPGAGVSSVEVAVKNVTDNEYWQGGAWLAGINWLSTSGSTAWLYNGTIPTWTDGKTYQITTKAMDYANNIETPGSGNTFTIDRIAGTTTITVPANSAKLKAIAALTGTAADNRSVALVEVSVKNMQNNTYYDITTPWGDNLTWLPATTGTTNWTYTLPTLASGVSYLIQARNTDTAGNVETAGTGNSFLFDSTNPSSTITYPSAGANIKTQPSEFSGTASDNAATVTLVKIRIYNVTDTLYFQGGSVWDIVDTWINAAGTTAWTFTVPALTDGKTYVVSSRAIDGAANNETAAEGKTFKYDTSAPVSVVTSPANGSSFTALAGITGTSTDTTSGVTLVKLRIKNITDTTYYDGSWTSSDPGYNLSVVGTDNWTYATPAWTSGKIYLIQVQGTDFAGNTETAGVGNSFKFDTTPPSSAITSPTNGQTLYSAPAPAGTASDNLAGVKKVQVNIKNITDTTYWTGSTWGADTWVDADGTTTWSSTVTVWTSNKDYQLRSKAQDNGLLWETPSSGVTFTYIADSTSPESAVVSPANGAVIKTFSSVSGTANDVAPNMSGLSLVRVYIKNVTDTQWWNGGSWSGTSTYITTTGANWTYSTGSVTVTNDKVYQIQSQAIDNATNTESLGTGSTFTYDTSAPNSTITSPLSGSKLKILAGITGTASDTHGLSVIKISIRNDTNNNYYDGGTWGGTETWLPATEGATSWNKTSPAWASGKTYIVKSMAVDLAGNEETPGAGKTFTFDNVAPSSVIVDPVNGSKLNTISLITGTASDPATGTGVVTVQVSYKRFSDTKYWNGGAWDTPQVWLNATGTANWSWEIPTPASGVTYLAQSKAIDAALNEESFGDGNSFLFDNQAPGSIITVPVSGNYYGALGTITGTASDTGSSGVSNIKLKIKNMSSTLWWDGDSWEGSDPGFTLSATGTSNWSYPAASWTTNKIYIIQSQATDNTGTAETAGAGNTFTFDDQVPTSTVVLPQPSTSYSSLAVITGTASDTGSAVSTVQLNIKRTTDNYVWSGTTWVTGTLNWVTAVGTTNWTYGDATWDTANDYTVQVRAMDSSTPKNVQSSYTSVNFSFDNVVPSFGTVTPASESKVNATGRVVAWTNSETLNTMTIQYKYKSGPADASAPHVMTITGLKLNAGAQTYDLYSFGHTLVEGTTYNIVLNANDNATPANAATTVTKTNVTYDTSAPVSAITFPANGNFNRAALGGITGTSSADTAASGVSVQIKDVTGNQFWTGSEWGADTWVVATDSVGVSIVQLRIKNVEDTLYWNGGWGASAWVNMSQAPDWASAKYDFNNANWTSQRNYIIETRGKDAANNTETPSVFRTFFIDKDLPASAVTNPSNGVITSALTNFSGTATDTIAAPGTGIVNVKVALKNLTDTTYYNGSTFVSGSTDNWVAVTGGTTSWYFTTPTLATDKIYQIKSMARDGAVNDETPGEGITFTYDNVVPTSTVTLPQPSTAYSSLAVITGTAADTGSAVSTVQLNIKRTTDGYVWSGSTWVTGTLNWVTATGTTNWTYGEATWNTANDYTVEVKAMDSAAPKNVQSSYTTVNFSFDNVIPNFGTVTPVSESKVNATGRVVAWTNSETLNAMTIRFNYKSGPADASAPHIMTITRLKLNSGAQTYDLYNDGHTLVEGTTYDIVLDATDKATPANSAVTVTKTNVTYDTSVPVSAITFPANGNFNRAALGGITGTSSADTAASGVSVQIKDVTGNQYWAGSDWGSATWLTATGTTAWVYDLSAVTFVTGSTYTLQSKAKDTGNNVESPSVLVTLVYDNDAPSSSPTYPANSANLKSLTVLSATATDSVGVSVLQMRIKNVEDTLYWNGGWGGSAWVNMSQAPDWANAKYDFNNANWTSQKHYIIETKGKDAANNTETPSVFRTFFIDKDLPVSAVTNPSNGAVISALTNFSGTANDTVAAPGTGVASVKVALRNLTDTTYYNGATFASGSTDNWIAVTGGTTSWYFASPVLASDKIYQIKSMATHGVANEETPGAGITFTFDNTPPTSVIVDPGNGTTVKALASISGTAADTSTAVSTVQLNIKRTTDGYVWSGSTWVTGTLNWVTATGTTNWTYGEATWNTANDYTVEVKAMDSAAPKNVQSSYTTVNFSFDRVIT